MKLKIWQGLGRSFLLSLLFMAVGVATAQTQTSDATVLTASKPNAALVINETSGATEAALYIVRLKDPALASYKGGISGLAPTSPRVTGAARLDVAAPASQAYLKFLEERQQTATLAVEQRLGRPVEVVFQYLAALNAFAVRLTPAEAARIADLPEVQAVYRDVERVLDTDVGPIHIDAPEIWDGNTGTLQATRGEGIVIGIIDSGINHAHPSFAATGGDGYTHNNPFGAGVFKGWCVANPGFCNDKLIAAYDLYPGGSGGPEDTDGHGSHTASTAGGNAHDALFTVGTTDYNLPIQGVAPHANIVAYKVCNPSCPETASIAAVDSAILNDQVNVLNYSISGSDSPWTDPVDLAFLDAFNAGIFVSASAGNDGPGPSTVAKTGPWNAAVAASTINRVIANTLDVTGPTTPANLQGLTAVPGENTSIVTDITGPIRYDPANINGCSAFSAGYFSGAMALIQRGGCTFDVKVTNAATAGAIGVLVFNNVGGPPISMGSLTGTPPAFMLDLTEGMALRDYIVANPTTATARINKATSYLINNTWEDIVAGFSSRGPSQYEILKPDYIAPGVNILAAVAASGGNPAQYAFYQGTSMSSPHGAGAAALMMALFPTWSPAEIKSALATTASGGLKKEDAITEADPFDVGSGLLALGGAARAGLVLDETHANYEAANPALGGDPKTLNQPSMANYRCAGACSWTRTVKAVVNGSWTASAHVPAGMTLAVVPNTFSLAPGETQELVITATVTGLPLDQWAFGEVILTPAAAPVANGAVPTTTHLPVVVKPAAPFPVIAVTPSGLAATQLTNTTTSQAMTIANLGTAPLTWDIAEVPGIVLAQTTAASPSLGAAAAHDTVSRSPASGAVSGDPAPIEYTSLAVFSEGFDDITNLPGWFFQNNSSPVGLTGWFQGNDAVFSAHNGASTAYIGANFNNTAGTGTISNWMLTPMLNLANGDTLSFWTRSTGGNFPDRLELRLSTKGASTNVGTLATDVGDFTTLLLSVNPNLTTTGYPEEWTQYTATLSGIPSGTSGRFAFRYFVTNGGPTGANSNYIGIDTVEYVSSACSQPADVPWLSLTPTSGTTAAGGGSNVTVGFDSTGLAVGTYTANLCISSNDPTAKGVAVPVELRVGEAPQPLISLIKTVGTTADECAADSSITVSAGTRVYYCYTVTNEGNVTFYAHDLADDQLGTLFSGHDYVLNPGSSLNTVDAGLPISSVINATTTNVGTWRAYNTGGSEATATASATVTVPVPPPVTYTISVSASPAEGGTVTGGGSYDEGATATVTAIPAQGWVFRYWLMNLDQASANPHGAPDPARTRPATLEATQITANPYSFTVTGGTSLTAVFERQEPVPIPTNSPLGLLLLMAMLMSLGRLMLRRSI